MDWSQAQKEMSVSLIPLYGEREAAAITDWVMEALSGWSRLDRMVRKTEPLSPERSAKYHRYREQLMAHRPVQYVLRESWFAGMRFYVDERVLIPRPETEELVAWAAEEVSLAAGARQGADGSRRASSSPGGDGSPAGDGRPGADGRPGTASPVPPVLLDIGTGSGCIAVALAKRLPRAEVHATDVSHDALEVARRNARVLGAAVAFHQMDFLDRRQWAELPPARWLISNPPYVPLHEKATMDPHVVRSEPALALFVPDADALVFYRALGEFGRQRLGKGGVLFAEIHEDRGATVKELLLQLGACDVILRKDMQGKDRMIKATW